MPFDLTSSEKNEIIIFHVPSGSRIKFYYKNIDTETQVRYKSSLLNSTIKDKSVDGLQMIQIEWGLKLITGIRKGDFVKDGKPISSDKDDENYYPEWKELLRKEAGSLIIKFVDTVLDSPCYQVKDEAADSDFFTGNIKPS